MTHRNSHIVVDRMRLRRTGADPTDRPQERGCDADRRRVEPSSAANEEEQLEVYWWEVPRELPAIALSEIEPRASRQGIFGKSAVKLFNRSFCFAVAILALALPGCGKKKEEAAKAPDPMMILPPEPAAPESKAKPTATTEGPNTAGDLKALNNTLRDYVRLKKVIPKDLDELVTSGFVRSLPTPPPGKKFVIMRYPLGYQVILVNQ